MHAVQRWEAFLHHWIWDAWRRYFRIRGIVPPPPYCEAGKPYIFAHFPHAGPPLNPLQSLSWQRAKSMPARLNYLQGRARWHLTDRHTRHPVGGGKALQSCKIPESESWAIHDAALPANQVLRK